MRARQQGDIGGRRVVLVTHTYDVGGASLRINSIIEAYKRLGYDIQVLVIKFSSRGNGVQRLASASSPVSIVSMEVIAAPLVLLEAVEKVLKFLGAKHASSPLGRLKYVVSRLLYLLPMPIAELLGLLGGSRYLRAAIRKLLKEAKIVQVEDLLAAGTVMASLRLGEETTDKGWLVYDAHNVAVALVSKNPIWRLLRGVMYRAERRAVSSFKIVFVPTQLDKKIVERYYNISTDKIIVVPNALPSSYIEYCEKILNQDDAESREALHLLFIGRMDYPPNREAREWILRRFAYAIADSIEGGNSQVKIIIAGKKEAKKLVKLSDNVVVYMLGELKDKLDIVLTSRADFVLAPLVYGGGSKYKSILALVCGRPLLSTLEGVRGLELKKIMESSIIVANNQRDKLIEKFLELLREQDKLLLLKTRAKDNASFFKRVYSSTFIATILKKLYKLPSV